MLLYFKIYDIKFVRSNKTNLAKRRCLDQAIASIGKRYFSLGTSFSFLSFAVFFLFFFGE